MRTSFLAEIFVGYHIQATAEAALVHLVLTLYSHPLAQLQSFSVHSAFKIHPDLFSPHWPPGFLA
jgi:hypothetical protein